MKGIAQKLGGWWLCFLAFPLPFCGATAYYLDALNGNDTTNTGTNAGSPWKTIAKVNAVGVIQSGDSIFLSRGGIWREELDLPGKAGNVVAAYGTGNAPVICGSNSVTGWTAQGSLNVWQAACTFAPGSVFFNGKQGTLRASLAEVTSGADLNYYYDYASHLYIHLSVNPSTYVIEAVRRPGINANVSTQLTVQNLEFRYCNNAIFNISDNTQIQSCLFRQFSQALSINGNNCMVSGNTLSASWSTSYQSIDNNGSGSTFANNVFTSDVLGICCEATVTSCAILNNYYADAVPIQIAGSNCLVAGNSLACTSPLDIRGFNGNTLTGNTFTNNGLELNSSTSNLIYQNQFHDLQATGILIHSIASADIFNNTITSCANGDGIVFYSGNNTITGNVVSYINVGGAGIESCSNSGGNLISNNLCDHCLGTGIWIVGSNSNQVLGNEIHNSEYGFSFDSAWNAPDINNQVAFNRIYNCTIQGIECAGSSLNANQVCYNLVYNCVGTNGIYFEQNSIDAIGNRVENNVLVGNQTGLAVYGTGVKACNNILLNNGTGILLSKPLATHVNNCLYNSNPLLPAVNNSGTLTDYGHVKTFEATAISADPQFVNAAAFDFHLKPNSPCIDTGTLTGYSRDLDGNHVPLGNGQEIGAYEYILSPHLTSLDWVTIPSEAFLQGSRNNLVGQINCHAYQYDVLQSLTVTNLDTALAGADISTLRLAYSPVSGNSLSAVAVGQFTSMDSKTWTLAGLNYQTADSSSYYLLADIAGAATLGRTCQFSLPLGAAHFQEAGGFPPVTFINANSQVINAINVIVVNPEISVNAVPSAVVRVVKGEAQTDLGTLALTNFTSHAVILNSLTLGLQTPAGQTLDPASVFSTLRLLAGGTTAASLNAPFASGLLFTLAPAVTLAAQTQLNLTIQGDIAAAPAPAQFKLMVLNNQCLNQGQTLSQTAGGAAFPLFFTPVSIRDPQLSSTFSNYPNPFTPSQGPTRIGYYLPQAAQVKLTLWTLDHRLVKTLEDEKRGAGMVEMTWDGRTGEGYTVHNGVYLLVLDCTYTAGGHDALTRKIAVAK
jgi:parallel beta-helix repeat protein